MNYVQEVNMKLDLKLDPFMQFAVALANKQQEQDYREAAWDELEKQE